MKFEKEFFAGAMDVDMNKKLTDRALLEMFSNITMLHGKTVGHTATSGISPVSWMAMNYKMQVIRRPEMFSTLRVVTWVSGYSKVRSEREYLVYLGDEIVAKGSAIWIAIDGETGNPLRMTDELMEGFGTVDEKNFPDYKYINPRKFSIEPTSTRVIETYRCMDDYNGHVHNSTYMEIAREGLENELYWDTYSDIEIVYKNEIPSASSVLLEYAKEDGAHIVAIKSPDGSKLHGAVVFRP